MIDIFKNPICELRMIGDNFIFSFKEESWLVPRREFEQFLHSNYSADRISQLNWIFGGNTPYVMIDYIKRLLSGDGNMKWWV